MEGGSRLTYLVCACELGGRRWVRLRGEGKSEAEGQIGVFCILAFGLNEYLMDDAIVP